MIALLAALSLVIPVDAHFECKTREALRPLLYRFYPAPLTNAAHSKIVRVHANEPLDFDPLDEFIMNCETNPAGFICMTPAYEVREPNNGRPHFLLVDSSSYDEENRTAHGDFFFQRNLNKERDYESVVCVMSPPFEFAWDQSASLN